MTCVPACSPAPVRTFTHKCIHGSNVSNCVQRHLTFLFSGVEGGSQVSLSSLGPQLVILSPKDLGNEGLKIDALGALSATEDAT